MTSSLHYFIASVKSTSKGRIVDRLTAIFTRGVHSILFAHPPPFNVYKACFRPRLGHYHSPSTSSTASITDTKLTRLLSYNPCIECHSRTIILCPQNTENIHQINHERRHLTHLALLHVHQDHPDKMDPNDQCQTIVSSNEHRVNVFGK